MRWSKLPPVGNPIIPVPSAHDPFVSWPFLRVVYVDSGTAALALAIKNAILSRGGDRIEVILPGYGCPDLVAACVWAGAVPVLVDLVPGAPWLNLDEVRSVCSRSTAAIVAVNFLGIRERTAELGRIAAESGSALIEDCAQWFPSEDADLPADFTICSFGRGKPVSLLGGGALLARASLAALPNPSDCKSVLLHAKARVYNWLLQPFFYGTLSRVFGSRIGQTHFHVLERVHDIDPLRRRWLGANVAAYMQRNNSIARLLRVSLGALRSEGLIDLANLRGCGSLLRYPLLLPTMAHADIAERALLDRGLGASRMYRSILPRIDSVPAEVLKIVGSLEHADDFSKRLLTLPVHCGVKESNVVAMVKTLRQVLHEPVS